MTGDVSSLVSSLLPPFLRLVDSSLGHTVDRKETTRVDEEKGYE